MRSHATKLQSCSATIDAAVVNAREVKLPGGVLADPLRAFKASTESQSAHSTLDTLLSDGADDTDFRHECCVRTDNRSS